MDKNTQLDKIRGSLIGGAVGDALGYPVEFMSSLKYIHSKYGENGITELDTEHWWSYGESLSLDKAWISDDTQMTLFTACGILNAENHDNMRYSICEAYLEWYLTQVQRNKKGYNRCWIKSIPELNVRRAPGNTCMSSLMDIFSGRDTENDSKGCGGIMRTAPVALYGAIDDRLAVAEAMMLSADAAEITHQHPLGWLPSALEAYVIYKLLSHDSLTVEDFKACLFEGYEQLNTIYPDQKDSIAYLESLTDKALILAVSEEPDCDNIESIGGGWVGDEAFAIAIYCTVKYFTDFEKAMIASVNHGGDSDSTGAVTGNILGAAVGYEAIPQHFKEKLELHDVILHVADDLWKGEHTKYNQ